MASLLVNLDDHTVTCKLCGTRERSIDISRTSPASLTTYVDRFDVEHRCGKPRKQPAPIADPTDPWKAAWQAYERNGNDAA